MPAWLTNFLINQVVPVIVSYIESQLPNLESEGLALLVKTFPGLAPLLQALGLMPKA